MITFITDFVGDINIPNPTANSERIGFFIKKYEPELLRNIFGYPLYKSYVNNPSDQRFLDIIFGREYVDARGNINYWKGLVYFEDFDSSVQYVSGYTQKPNRQIQAGVTAGLVSGSTGFTFDGTLGTEDWRGETIIIERAEFGVMFEGLDYSWYKDTAVFLLLHVSDIIAQNQRFNVMFNPKPIINNINSSLSTVRFNVIANYIYWFYTKDNTIWNAAVGTKIAKGDNVIDISPALKMNRAWNEFVSSTKEFVAFVLSLPNVYPEYSMGIASCAYNWFDTVNEFDI